MMFWILLGLGVIGLTCLFLYVMGRLHPETFVDMKTGLEVKPRVGTDYEIPDLPVLWPDAKPDCFCKDCKHILPSDKEFASDLDSKCRLDPKSNRTDREKRSDYARYLATGRKPERIETDYYHAAVARAHDCRGQWFEPKGGSDV